MEKLLKKVHPTLLEMWMIMAVWGLLLQLVILIVTKRRLYYSIGCWAGVVMAVVLSGLMLRGIVNALDREEKAATAYAHKQYTLRLLLLFVIFAVLAFSKAGSVVTAFFGVFSLKPAAYLQPWVHKLPTMKSNFEIDSRVQEASRADQIERSECSDGK